MLLKWQVQSKGLSGSELNLDQPRYKSTCQNNRCWRVERKWPLEHVGWTRLLDGWLQQHSSLVHSDLAWMQCQQKTCISTSLQSVTASDAYMLSNISVLFHTHPVWCQIISSFSMLLSTTNALYVKLWQYTGETIFYHSMSLSNVRLQSK